MQFCSREKKKTKKLLKSDTESIAASIIYWHIIYMYTDANPYHTDAEPAYCICKNLVAMTKLRKKSLLKDIELHNQCGFLSRGVWTGINLQDRDVFWPLIVAWTSQFTSSYLDN